MMIERLESRVLLSVAPGVADPYGTTTITWQGNPLQVAKDQWLVRLAGGASLASLQNASGVVGLGSGASISMLDSQSPFALLSDPGSSVQAIAQWASSFHQIATYEPDFVVQADGLPNDPVFAQQSTADGMWGLANNGLPQLQWNGSAFVPSTLTGTPGDDINASGAWNVTTGSTSDVIGVIDTGIDYTHPDLYQNIWLNDAAIPPAIMSHLHDVDGDGLITFHDLNDPSNSAYVTDFNHNGYIDAGDLLQDPRWMDGIDHDHSGHPNDIIGWNFVNNTNNPLDDFFHGTHVAGTIGAMGNNGVGVTGINWNAQLMDLKFLNSSGSGFISDAVKAVDYATEMKTEDGVNVVATNNSWSGGGFSQDLMDAITRAGQANILFIAAAGNSALNNDVNSVYPSNLPNDNIIAVAAIDSNNQLASFSDYGATTVDLGAPGVNILSTLPTYITAAMTADGLGTYYGTLSGTSMATPHVTGVVGLLASISPAATAAEIKQAILSGVSLDPALAGKTVTGGTLNAAASLAMMPTTRIFTVSDPTDNFDGNYSPGHLSLREALALAASQTVGHDIINFSPSLAGDTITLSDSLGQLNITHDVTIEGLGSGQLTINGGGDKRVFSVSSGINATIQDLTITGGYTFPSGPGPGPYDGAGIYNAGNLTLDHVVITGNSALAGGGIGQDIAAANLQITDSNISSNTGIASPGGGLYIAAGTAQILQSTISNNSSSIEGGGIYFSGTSLTLTDSTVSGNAHDGVRINTGTATILDSTITNNTITPIIPPQFTAGGVDGNSGTTLINTIVAGNTGSDIDGTFNAASHNNLIGDGSKGNLVNGSSGNLVGTTASPIDPQLTPLGNYGGFTQTQELQPTSPAIDAGDNSAVPSLVLTDQRGVSRISNGTVDIGSVEHISGIVVTTLTDENDGRYGPGQLSLREALFLASVQPGPDLITFDPSLANGTIKIDSTLGPLVVGSDVTIEGLGSGSLTINGQNQSRVFYVNPGVNATIEDLTVTGGYVFPGPPPYLPQYSGSGIYNGGNLTLDRVVISGNQALYGAGVGQETSGANVDIIDSTITNNTGIASPGGGIYITTGSAEILRSAIYNNNSDIYGAGVFFSGTTLTMTNSTVTGNIHEGVRIQGGTATILNSTITNNTATSIIPPQYADGGVDGTSGTTLINTIVAGNGNGDIYGTFNAASHNNLIGDGTKGNLTNGSSGNLVGTTASPINPQLLPLANNGGLTLTQLPQANSPALNAGDNSAVAGITTDQRGGPRIIGANVDIGSVETSMVVTTAADVNNGNYSYNDLSLREAIALAAATPGLDVITFASSLAGSTITVDPTLGPLLINTDVQINGLGANQLTISGNGHSRVFYVNPGVNATLTDMEITGGYVFPGPPPSAPPYSGSGIYNAGNLTLTRMLITGNNALEGAGVGQETAGANVSITDSTISNNTGIASPGGGIYISAGSAQINRSTINSNNSNIEGGGIYFTGSSLLLTNSTITGNTHEGVRANGTSATIVNCTITNNTDTPIIPPPYAAGGLDGNSNVIVINTIVAGNAGGDINGTFNSSSHNNFIGDGSEGNLVNGVNGNQVGTTASPLNPQLTTLGNYGGPTLTQLPLAGSPVIDAGDSSAASSFATDQRGLTRIVGAAVDIGATESSAPIIVSTLADNSDGNYSFGQLSLREALALAQLVPGTTTILFDSSLDGGTITTSDALGFFTIASNVQIEGPGAGLLTISGGGLWRNFWVNSGVTATISGLTLTGGATGRHFNDPSPSGGGIYNAGNLTLDHVVMTGENCFTSGGAIYENGTGANLNITDSTVENNNALIGAALFVDAGNVTINASTITDNVDNPIIIGGVIQTQGTGTMQFLDSTITGNFGEGFRLFSSNGPDLLLNCTVTDNLTSSPDASYSAGGVNGTPNVILVNTIVAGNLGGDIQGTFNTASHNNLIGNGDKGNLTNGVNSNMVGTTAAPIDPGLAPLANNGGPTMTQTLLFGSVAIDAGDNTAAAALLFDQRGAGFARIKNGGHGLIVDIGAYEL